MWKSLWVTCREAVRRPVDLWIKNFYLAAAAMSILLGFYPLPCVEMQKILYNRRFFANINIFARFYEKPD